MNEQILENIRQLKRRLAPDGRLILFGSQARGDATPESDWDLLLLIDKDNANLIEDYNTYGYPFDELGFRFNTPVNTLVYTVKDWEKGKIFPFYKNVMQEGIEIT
ncbi:MAG: nucleotidyltransferase domain-containing protein [Tannerella sp.]|jgi:predicted nucleotidyltransferase|nr:nucleotidyltransferase domain-containing protein [Tannerella sp.]